MEGFFFFSDLFLLTRLWQIDNTSFLLYKHFYISCDDPMTRVRDRNIVRILWRNVGKFFNIVMLLTFSPTTIFFFSISENPRKKKIELRTVCVQVNFMGRLKSNAFLSLSMLIWVSEENLSLTTKLEVKINMTMIETKHLRSACAYYCNLYMKKQFESTSISTGLPKYKEMQSCLLYSKTDSTGHLEPGGGCMFLIFERGSH